MSYIAMGDVSSDKFNSTKYPGVCKPSDVATLATFKRCQAQLNRVATVKGAATIAVDGDIGPGTLGLFGKFQTELVSYAMNNQDVAAATKIGIASSSDCSSVAKIADVIANIADSYADALKAPATAPAPKPAKPPVLVSSTGIETAPPVGAGLFSAWEQSSTATKIAAIAVAGGLAFVALGGSLLKKPRAKSRYRRNPARPRRKKARSASAYWNEYLGHVRAGRRKAAEKALDRYMAAKGR